MQIGTYSFDHGTDLYEAYNVEIAEWLTTSTGTKLHGNAGRRQVQEQKLNR